MLGVAPLPLLGVGRTGAPGVAAGAALAAAPGMVRGGVLPGAVAGAAVDRGVGAGLGDAARIGAGLGAGLGSGRGVEAPGFSGSIGPGARVLEVGLGSGKRKSLAGWAIAASVNRASTSAGTIRAVAPDLPLIINIKRSKLPSRSRLAQRGLNGK